MLPHDEYYFGLLHSTGTDLFNQHMRKIALEKGYTLNEYNLRKLGSGGVPGKPVDVKSEQDIFKCLDMEYKSPEERNM